MTFSLHLELATRVGDSRLLELLRFPSSSRLAGIPRWQAQYWSRGHSKQLSSSDREEILQEVAVRGINELRMECKTTAMDSFIGANPRVSSASVWFNPSPRSQLWSQVPGSTLENPTAERKRKVFGGRELYDRMSASALPSILECCDIVVENESSADDLDLQSVSVELIRDSMPPELLELSIFGYGSLRGKFRWQTMLNNLGGYEKWIDQLGQKFENIYPILIGPRDVCEGLASELGGNCSLHSFSVNAPSVIISISPDKVPEMRVDPKIKKWVINRDISAMDLQPDTLDEMFAYMLKYPTLYPFPKR